MKNEFSSLCLIMLFFMACSKDNSEYELLEGPASLGGVYPTFYFVIQDSNDNFLAQDINKVVPKLYFFDKGNKVYNSDFLVESQSKNIIVWSKVAGNSCNQSNLRFDEILSDNTIYKLNAENGINEFYLEWLGEEVGKINFNTTKQGSEKLVKVSFNNNLVRSSNLACLSYFIFKLD